MKTDLELPEPDLWQRATGEWSARLRCTPMHGRGATRREAAERLGQGLRKWTRDWLSGENLIATDMQTGEAIANYIDSIDDDDQLLAWIETHAKPCAPDPLG